MNFVRWLWTSISIGVSIQVISFLISQLNHPKKLKMVESEIPKRVEFSNGSCSNDIDRISNLSDDLISQILSLLPTKKAVATSVLSTRWKFLWTSITNLDFNFDSCDAHHFYGSYLPEDEMEKRVRIKRRKFTCIVKRVLSLLTSPSIHKFSLCLCCRNCFNLNCLKSWISVGFGRTVDEFTLDVDNLDERRYLYLPIPQICCDVSVFKLHGDIYLDIPQTASLCLPSLKVLDLFGVTFEIASNASVSFPNLKIMRLNRVKFDNEGSINKLLSSSPLLDDLDIANITYNDMEEVIIHISSLTRLSIHISRYEYTNMCKIKINAPALQYLYLNGESAHECLTGENLSSLLQADLIRLFHDQDYVNVESSIIKFIRTLSKVKSLHVPGHLQKAFRILSTSITSGFHYLTRLQITLSDCLDLSMLFTGFLESMHNLEHLAVMQQAFTYKNIECPKQSWWTEPLNVPKCLIRRLTTVSFLAINGCSDQLELLRYFLKNAVVLQMLTLGAKRISRTQKTVLLQKILLMPRASHTCQVAFIDM